MVLSLKKNTIINVWVNVQDEECLIIKFVTRFVCEKRKRKEKKKKRTKAAQGIILFEK